MFTGFDQCIDGRDYFQIFFEQFHHLVPGIFLLLICWITFLGFGKLVVDREDISITFLVDKLDPVKRKIVNVANAFLLMMTSGVMLVYSINLTINHLNKKTIIMKAPTSWFYAPLVLLLALVVLTSLHHIMLTLKTGKLQEGE